MVAENESEPKHIELSNQYFKMAATWLSLSKLLHEVSSFIYAALLFETVYFLSLWEFSPEDQICSDLFAERIKTKKIPF